MNAEFEREVGDGTRSENADVFACPKRAFRHVFLEAAIGDIDARLEREFHDALLEFFGRVFAQKRDQVVVQRSPPRGVDEPEHFVKHRTPAPPKVVSHFDAFLIGGQINAVDVVLCHFVSILV